MNFNFETIGYNLTSAHEFLTKNMPSFLRFMVQNDVKILKQSKRLTSFLAMKHKKCGIFFR